MADNSTKFVINKYYFNEYILILMFWLVRYQTTLTPKTVANNKPRKMYIMQINYYTHISPMFEKEYVFSGR